MSDSYLLDLVQTAARIVELDELEGEVRGTREWKAGKEEWKAQKQHFEKLRKEYVDQLLQSEPDSNNLLDDVQRRIEGLRAQADPSWYAAICYTEQNLLPYLTRESRKSPSVRKAQKAAPFVLGALLAVTYFGVALISRTPVSASIEARDGIVQRAAAAEKAIRYDDWMDTRVRKGGWIKGILLWPVEPNDDEVRAAGEFVGLVLAGQQYASGCSTAASSSDTLSSEQIKLIRNVAAYVRRDDVQWHEPPVATIVAALASTGSC